MTKTRHGATRRDLLALAAALAAGGGAATREALATPLPTGERHGLSIFGDLKYAADFRHFDWVNPDAPKGGRLITQPSNTSYNQDGSTFNSLHDLILKGDGAVGLDLTRVSLMARAMDEPDAVYGLLARSVEITDGGNTLVFRLRPEARFHDGSPVTAADVAFSLETLKAKGHPQLAEPLREMVAAEARSPDVAVVRLSGKQGRSVATLVAQMPIVSKAWWSGRDFEASTLEVPLGNGPYRIARVEPGRSIDYERVPDWWGADLPVAKGQWNFDVIRYEFYREPTAGFEAFKAGSINLREEFSSLGWATKYDFPAVADGRVKRIELEDHSPSGAQGWFLNTRRPMFRDARVREALGLAFDFEWSNTKLFYGLYKRTPSFFVNSDLEASGEPSAAELALLEPYRDRLPAEVFGPLWQPPVSDGSGQDRRLLKRASELLAAAGWVRRGDTLVDASGKPFEIEFLESDTFFSRIAGPYMRNLQALGIRAHERVVDPSQYEKRIQNYDFDVTSRRYSLAPTPDEGIRQFWHSSAANRPGSYNLAGIADPVVDALIEAILAAGNREALVTAAHALDRVLRSGRWWVSHWYKASHSIAAWNVFGRPATKPRYDRAVESTWWIERAKP